VAVESARFKRGAEVLKEIGQGTGRPMDPRERFPHLPGELADDVGTKLTEFCFGDTWGRQGSHIDMKTRRFLTIGRTRRDGQGAPAARPFQGALNQGISKEEITEALVHLIAYIGFPGGLTALQIADEVFGKQKA